MHKLCDQGKNLGPTNCLGLGSKEEGYERKPSHPPFGEVNGTVLSLLSTNDRSPFGDIVSGTAVSFPCFPAWK